jgi:hypothetical protein
MSRFDQEWALVPTGARWTAVFVFLAFAAAMGLIFVVPVAVEQPKALPFVSPIFLASLLGGVGIAIYVLLVGYVYGDARRRGMNQVLWTLLAIFIPNAIGIILYFVLRDPIPIPCPSCGALARKGHSFCAKCGTAVCRCCAQCRQPVEPGWSHCARCGTSLAAS